MITHAYQTLTNDGAWFEARIYRRDTHMMVKFRHWQLAGNAWEPIDDATEITLFQFEMLNPSFGSCLRSTLPRRERNHLSPMIGVH